MTLTSEQPARITEHRRGRGRPPRPHTHTAPSAPTGIAAPKLADGVTLLGEYAGTGYKEPQHLARRSEGQLVQLTALLHHIADAADGIRGYDEIAELVSADYGQTVSADNVRTLVEDKLRPLGILAAADGSSPETEPADPLLGLKLRTQVLSPRVVRGLSRLFHPLFWPPVVLTVVVGLVAVDYWLFFVHGLAQGMRATVEQPAVFLIVMGVIVVATAFHEMGHAAACSYGGAKPGGMGFGIYIIWPAFYTDVTEAYQLSRGGRLRTDLGGVYFHAIAVLVVAGTYSVTGYDPLILLCFLLQVQVLQQLLPLLRLDGYYVLADLVGVPDLFRRIGPVLRSALPFRRNDPAVDELKPWVRAAVTGWVLVVVPALLLNLGYIVLSAPRLVATGWDSGMRLLGGLDGAARASEVAWVGVQLALLVLPFLGVTYTLGRAGGRACRGAWCWSADSAPRRLVVTSGMGTIAVGLALAWWPDGRLQPYREGETGTVQQHIQEAGTVGEGAPLLRNREEAQERLEPVEEGTSPVRDSRPRDDAGTEPTDEVPQPDLSTDPTAPSEAPDTASFSPEPEAASLSPEPASPSADPTPPADVTPSPEPT